MKDTMRRPYVAVALFVPPIITAALVATLLLGAFWPVAAVITLILALGLPRERRMATVAVKERPIR